MKRALCACLILGSGLSSQALAQEGGSIVSQAADAFGQRVGNEQVGLYSENRVRGFGLQNAGNYRIDGHYFMRVADLPDAVLDGVTIQVGTNALNSSFPAPSGVIAFSLREPGEGPRGLVGQTGLRGYASPIIELGGWMASADRTASLAGGVQASPRLRFPDGTHGSEFDIGVVPRWQVGAVRVTGLASYGTLRYDGDYEFSGDGTALPPRLPAGTRSYGPKWARSEMRRVNLGAIADWQAGGGWGLSGALFWSDRGRPADDYTEIRLRPDRSVEAVTFLSRDQYARALSGDVEVGRRFAALGGAHRLFLALRYRASRTRSSAGEGFAFAAVDIDDIDYGDAPRLAGAAAVKLDTVRQNALGIGYEGSVGDLFKLRIGAQFVDYRRSVDDGAEIRRSREKLFLYDASLIVPLSPSWLIYGAYTRGLEEKGQAPNNAANRNEVLPVVEAEQLEVGVKARLFDRLSFVSTLFRVTKPHSAFLPDGHFGLTGQVRHQGVEFSLSGEAARGLSVAAGLLLLDRAVTGVGPRYKPIAIPGLTAQMNLDYKLTPRVSVDGRITYNASKPVEILDRYRVPDITSVDVGARYAFALGGRDAALRGRIQNLTANNGWDVGPSGAFSRIGARTYMLTLQVATARSR